MWLLSIPLFLVIPWLPIPQDIHRVTFALGLALVAAMRLIGGKGIVLSGMSLLWLGLASLSFLHVESGREWVDMARGEALCIVAVVLLMPLERKWAGTAPLLGLIAVCCNAWLLLAGPEAFHLSSPFNQKNAMHAANVLVLAFLGGELWPRKGEPSRSWFPYGALVWAGALACAGSILHSDAKAAQLALAVACATLVLARIPGGPALKPWVWRSVSVVGILAVGLAMPLWIVRQPALLVANTFTSRQDIWAATWALIRQHWLLGVGSHSFPGWIRETWPPLSLLHYPNQLYPAGAHDFFLNAWAELGLLGMIFTVAIMALAMSGPMERNSLQRDWRDQVMGAFAIGYLSVLSSTYAGHGFLPSILGLVAFTMACRPAALSWNVALSPQLSRACLSVLLVLLGWNAYAQYQRLEAVSMVSRIFVNHHVEGMMDVQVLQGSLSQSPNSIAAFYASGVFLQNRDFAGAASLIRLTESLSGSQWPVERRWFEWNAMQGKCGELQLQAKWISTHVPADQLAWISEFSRQCYDQWQDPPK